MNKKSIMMNLSVAFLAQGVSMVLSILQTLLVPKVLGVQQFSYWQLYLFYVGYVGFFHFGLSSGVYLEMGGISRDQIDKDSVKSQFIFGLLFQTVIAIAICFMSRTITTDENRRFVIVMTGVALVLKNAAVYMMNVLQCMNETKKSSVSTIVERIAFLLPLVVLMATRSTDFRPYVYAYTAAAVAQVLFCLWNLSDFIHAKWLGLLSAFQLSSRSIAIGISLMLANIASILILGIARFFIDMKWGIETFGKLSLVLSLVNFFLTFVNQAGLVLFPALRQSEEEEIRRFYGSARDCLSLLFPAAYLLYFPMVWVLGLWLPNYADAFGYITLLLPICVFDSKMSITGSTYFNVLRKERVMLLLNCSSAVLSFILAFIGSYLIGDVTIVIAGMTTVIIIRSIVTELYLSHCLGVQTTPLTVCEVVLSVCFIISERLLPAPVAIAVYAFAYGFYLFYFRDTLARLLGSLKG